MSGDEEKIAPQDTVPSETPSPEDDRGFTSPSSGGGTDRSTGGGPGGGRSDTSDSAPGGERRRSGTKADDLGAGRDDGFERRTPPRTPLPPRWSDWLTERMAPVVERAAQILETRVLFVAGRSIPPQFLDAVVLRHAQRTACMQPTIWSTVVGYAPTGSEETLDEQFLLEDLETTTFGDERTNARVFEDPRRLDLDAARVGPLTRALEDPSFPTRLEAANARYVLVTPPQGDAELDTVAGLIRAARRRGFDDRLVEVPWLPVWLDGHLLADRLLPAQADALLLESASVLAETSVDRAFAWAVVGSAGFDLETPSTFATTFADALAGAQKAGTARTVSSKDLAKMANPMNLAVMTFASFAPGLPEPIFRDLVDIALPNTPAPYENLQGAQKSAYDRAVMDDLPPDRRPQFSWQDLWRENADQVRTDLSVVIRTSTEGRKGIVVDRAAAWRTQLAERWPDLIRRILLQIIDRFMPQGSNEHGEPLPPTLTAESQAAVNAVLRVLVATGSAIDLATPEKIAEWLVFVARPSADAEEDDSSNENYVAKYARRVADALRIVAGELVGQGANDPNLRDVLRHLLSELRADEVGGSLLAAALVRLESVPGVEGDLADEMLRRLLDQSNTKVRDALRSQANAILPFRTPASRRATLIPMLTRLAGSIPDKFRRSEDTGKERTALVLLAQCVDPEVPIWGPYALPHVDGREEFGALSSAGIVFGQSESGRRLIEAVRDFDPMLWPLAGLGGMRRIDDLFWSSVAGPPRRLFERDERLSSRLSDVFARRILAPAMVGAVGEHPADIYGVFTEAGEAAMRHAAATLAFAADRHRRAAADDRRAARAALMPLRLFVPMLLAEWRFQRFGPSNNGLADVDAEAIRRYLSIIAEGSDEHVEFIVDGWRRLARLADAFAAACRNERESAMAVYGLKRDRFEAMARTVERLHRAPRSTAVSPKSE